MRHPMFTVNDDGQFCVMYGWSSPSACVWIIPGEMED